VDFHPVSGVFLRCRERKSVVSAITFVYALDQEQSRFSSIAVEVDVDLLRADNIGEEK
jgi:hypothetical protein